MRGRVGVDATDVDRAIEPGDARTSAERNVRTGDAAVRYAAADAPLHGFHAEPRLRAPAVLARDDAGAAVASRPPPARHRRRRRHRRRLHRDQRRACSRRAGAAVTLLEAEHARLRRLDPQRRDRPPGLQVGPAGADRALRRRDAAGRCSTRRWTATRSSSGSSPTRRSSASSARRGYLDLAWAPVACPATCASRSGRFARFGIDAAFVPRERPRRRDRLDLLPRRARLPAERPAPPGQVLRGPGRAAAAAGADLHEGVRARTIRRQADGRLVVETDRGAILAKDVVVGTNGYTDGVVPALRRRIIPIGSYIIATEPLPEELARILRRAAGPSSTRRTSSTTGTSRRTAG